MSQYPSEKQFTLNYGQGGTGSIESEGQKVYLGGVKKEKRDGRDGWFVIKSDCGQYSFNLNPSKDSETGAIIPGRYYGYLEKHGERVTTLNANIRDGVSITRFIYWLKNEMDINSTDEISAANHLKNLNLFLHLLFEVYIEAFLTRLPLRSIQ